MGKINQVRVSKRVASPGAAVPEGKVPPRGARLEAPARRGLRHLRLHHEQHRRVATDRGSSVIHAQSNQFRSDTKIRLTNRILGTEILSP